MAAVECKNCNLIFDGNFCPQCGQRADQIRFTIKKLLGEFIFGFVHIRRGFLFTLKELFLRPGDVLRGYLEGKRVNYYRPFSFLVLISLAGSFLYSRLGIIEYINEHFIAAGEIINFTRKYFSYRLLIAIPAYALTCWIIFNRSHYNFAEQLIINTFLISQSIVFMIIWFIVTIILKPGTFIFTILYVLAFISVIIYQTYVFIQLFNTGKIFIRLAKSITAVLFGLGLSFVLSTLLVKLVTILGLY